MCGLEGVGLGASSEGHDDHRLLAFGSSGARAETRAVASAHIALLDARIAELSAARDALVRLAAACAETEGACPILAALMPT